MADITIPIVVGKDRKIIIEVPDDVPLGPAEVVIKSKETIEGSTQNPNREAIRAKMLSAGILSTAHRAPDNVAPLSDEELYKLDQRPAGSKSIDDLIDEDRGIY